MPSPPSPITSMSSMSSVVIIDLESLLASSKGTPYLTLDRKFIEFENIITVLHNEVEKSRYLVDWSRTLPPWAPQLQLLEEWSLDGDTARFRKELCIVPDVFAGIAQCIGGYPVFYNASNNPQLPVPIQLAIFLNAAGHYGNVSTTEDLAEWAGDLGWHCLQLLPPCHDRCPLASWWHYPLWSDGGQGPGGDPLGKGMGGGEGLFWLAEQLLVHGRFTIQSFPKAWLAQQRLLWQKIAVFIVITGRYCTSPQVVVLTPVIRSSSCHTIFGLSTMWSGYLGVFTTLHHSRMLKFIVTPRHSSVQTNGYGLIPPIHHLLGVLYHSRSLVEESWQRIRNFSIIIFHW